MPNETLPYRYVGNVGHCLILAQILGTEQTGEEIPSFFAAYMLKDGKPATSLAEATDIQRVSRNRNTYTDLIGFCQGFSAAAQMWRGVRPDDWPYPGTIDPKQVWDLKHNDPEMKRLRAWPNRPAEPNEPFILSPVSPVGKDDIPPHEQDILNDPNTIVVTKADGTKELGNRG